MTHRRILIVGSCGAGKSRLARRLARKTGLPLIHLDREYYSPGWERPESKVWEQRVYTLCQKTAWIMDGNYFSTLTLRLENADLVIWLDTGRCRCLWRVLKRALFEKTRSDMAPGCRERWDWAFLRYVWDFDRQMRPRITGLLDTTRAEVAVLRDKQQVEAWLKAYAF